MNIKALALTSVLMAGPTYAKDKDKPAAPPAPPTLEERYAVEQLRRQYYQFVTQAANINQQLTQLAPRVNDGLANLKAKCEANDPRTTLDYDNLSCTVKTPAAPGETPAKPAETPVDKK